MANYVKFEINALATAFQPHIKEINEDQYSTASNRMTSAAKEEDYQEVLNQIKELRKIFDRLPQKIRSDILYTIEGETTIFERVEPKISDYLKEQ